ncbi:1,6-anhydro-N-acetylmuramyl-L-alanine amidase AmpD [Eionea flava]
MGSTTVLSNEQSTSKPLLAINEGWLSNADARVRHVVSPNYNERPSDTIIDLLVVHNISLPPGQFGNGYIEQFFTNQLPIGDHPYFTSIDGVCVSAHLLITRLGEIIQFVPFTQRAWHAGRSCFDGREECNDFSVGIELEGTDELPYTDQQYAILADVARALMQAYPAMAIDRIVGHSDIAPGRKSDPGEAFDWPRFRGLLTAISE